MGQIIIIGGSLIAFFPVDLRLNVFDLRLQFVDRNFNLMEGTAFQAVRQSKLGRQGNVSFRDGIPAFECRMSARGFEDYQVRAVAVNLKFGGESGDEQ